MKSTRSLLLVTAWFLLAGLPASAQVERVIVEADGLSNSCASGLQAALKSMESVYQYAVSVPKQMFSVTYYADERFDPKKLRWAADKGEAEIIRFHVSAEGVIKDEGDHQIFVAGEDQFQIVGNPKPLPVGIKVGIMGVVDDSATPWQMKPDDVKIVDDDSGSSAQAQSANEGEPSAQSAPGAPSEPSTQSAPSKESAPK